MESTLAKSYNDNVVNEPRINPSLDPAHLETVLDSVSDAVLTMTRDFVITSFNRSAERITGFRRTEVIGRPCHEIMRSAGCRKPDQCPMTMCLRNGCPLTTRQADIYDRRNAPRLVRLSFQALRDLSGEIAGGVETFSEVLPGNGAELLAGCDDLPILEATERQAIEAILRRHNWNRTAASRELGISRITLWRKMRKLGITPRASRVPPS